LLDGLNIRNRITHPKLMGQLEITNEELETVKRGMEWTHALMEKMQSKHHEECMNSIAQNAIKRARMERETQIAGLNSEEMRNLRDAIVCHEIKYNIIYNIGFIGETDGVELQLKRFWMYEGKKALVVDDNDRIFADYFFPVVFSADYHESSGNA
jgi:hypothetical protein